MKTIAQIILARGGLEHLSEHAISIRNESYMPLTIEYVGAGPRGNPAIAVSHHYLQNGDVMEDPGMVFTVNTREDEESIASGISWRCEKWVPVSYTQHNLGIYQEAVFTAEDGRIITRPKLVKDLTAFSKQWDRNIKAQGFAEAGAK